ncbi:MAG: hypothetical protein HZB13_18605, partial [Acidobacteria bacterium]|nr:hypothetical protein [Acidobacteriota bacterium]
MFLAVFPLWGQTPGFYAAPPRLVFGAGEARKAAEAWEKAGVPAEGDPEPLAVSGVRLRGKDTRASMVLFWSHFANVRADWVQPVNGASAIAEAVKSRGGGLFAVQYRAPSREALELETLRLQALGVQLLEQGAIEFDDNYKVSYAYFDTVAAGGVALGLYFDPEPESEAVRGKLEVAQVMVTVPDPAAAAAYWRRIGFATGTPWAPLAFLPNGAAPALVFEPQDLDDAVSQWSRWGFAQTGSGSSGQAGGQTASPGYERYSVHANSASPVPARLRWRWHAPAVLAAAIPLQFTFPAGQAAPEFR